MENWTISSYTGGEQPNCVECRAHRGRVLVRDTRNRSWGHLSFPDTEWRALVDSVQRGEF